MSWWVMEQVNCSQSKIMAKLITTKMLKIHLQAKRSLLFTKKMNHGVRSLASYTADMRSVGLIPLHCILLILMNLLRYSLAGRARRTGTISIMSRF